MGDTHRMGCLELDELMKEFRLTSGGEGRVSIPRIPLSVLFEIRIHIPIEEIRSIFVPTN